MGLSVSWWCSGACRQEEVGRLNTVGSNFSKLNSLVKKEADSGAQVVAGSGVTEWAGAVDRTSDSNCCNWFMKLKLGEMTWRRCLMMSKAASSLSRCVRMM